MKEEDEIKAKIESYRKREGYLIDFLSTIYEDDNINKHIDKELSALRRERNALEWVLESKEKIPF